jgi:hypothetical protein
MFARAEHPRTITGEQTRKSGVFDVHPYSLFKNTLFQLGTNSGEYGWVNERAKQ